MENVIEISSAMAFYKSGQASDINKGYSLTQKANTC